MKAGEHRFAVLIPSRGRPEVLGKTLKGMPFLNHITVLIGVEEEEEYPYRKHALERYVPEGRHIIYRNPTGSVAVAREALRQMALTVYKKAEWFVVTDDNARYTHESLKNLVRAAASYSTHTTPCVMAGMHSTAPHFDRHRIAASKEVRNGLTTYANVGMIFQVYPRSVFEEYSYPPDSYGLDDRHFALWLINKGITNFRICMDAPFTKQRYQGVGGQGTTPERARKCGLAIARLATDFPDMVGAQGTLRIPWQLILDMKGGKVPDRLAGGAMRKESALRDKR